MSRFIKATSFVVVLDGMTSINLGERLAVKTTKKTQVKPKAAKVTKKAVTVKRPTPALTPASEVSGEEIPQKQGKVGYKNPPVDTRFKPGVSPNPGGKPVGSRNKLQGDFMRELCEDFAVNGRRAIELCRLEKPDAYVKVIASLMPKEFEIKRPLEELSEDELVASVGALQAFLNGQKPTSKNTH